MWSVYLCKSMLGGFQLATQTLCALWTLMVVLIPLHAHRVQHVVFVHLLAGTTGFSSAQPVLMLHTHQIVLTGLLHHTF